MGAAHDSRRMQVEIDEVARLVRHVGSEILADYAVPCLAMLPVRRVYAILIRRMGGGIQSWQGRSMVSTAIGARSVDSAGPPSMLGHRHSTDDMSRLILNAPVHLFLDVLSSVFLECVLLEC